MKANSTKWWLGAAIVFACCAGAAWLSPAGPAVVSGKAQTIGVIFTSILQPVIAAIGKIPVFSAFCVLFLYALMKAAGLGMPKLKDLPSLDEIRLGEQAATPAPDIATLPADRMLALRGEEPEDDGKPEVTSPPHRPRPIVLMRRPRERGEDWSHWPSHLGGLPRLGNYDWPKGKDGVPLPFAAQIDLAEIARACPESPLPHEGSLAFFIGEGAVVHVPADVTGSTPAPHDLPPAYDEGGYPLPPRQTRLSRGVFPMWPVVPVVLDLPDGLPLPDSGTDGAIERIEEAQTKALKSLHSVPDYSFNVSSAREAGLASSDQLWWYGAQLLAEQLHLMREDAARQIAYHEGLVEKAEAYRAKLRTETPPDHVKIASARAGAELSRSRIALVQRQSEGLAELITNFDAFIGGRDPWEVMDADCIAIIADVIQTAKQDFAELDNSALSRSLDDLRNICLRRMITGDTAAFAGLPDDMLALINHEYGLTSAAQHQMFGIGACPQEALWDHLDDHLLLQIAYDSMVNMEFGDMGVYQFWISPADLAARRWEAAVLTFECS